MSAVVSGVEHKRQYRQDSSRGGPGAAARTASGNPRRWLEDNQHRRAGRTIAAVFVGLGGTERICSWLHFVARGSDLGPELCADWRRCYASLFSDAVRGLMLNRQPAIAYAVLMADSTFPDFLARLFECLMLRRARRERQQPEALAV